MLRHYITKYKEGDRYYAESWLQLELFGKVWCFSCKNRCHAEILGRWSEILTAGKTARNNLKILKTVSNLRRFSFCPVA